jgi:hypothetical protein
MYKSDPGACYLSVSYNGSQEIPHSAGSLKSFLPAECQSAYDLWVDLVATSQCAALVLEGLALVTDFRISSPTLVRIL